MFNVNKGNIFQTAHNYIVELIASRCCKAQIINGFKNGLDEFIIKHNGCVQSLAEEEIAQESH